MSRNSRFVTSALVVKNDAVLAKENGVEDLAVGQIGVFDVDTAESVDATSDLDEVRRFFLAVGTGNGATATDDVRSAGTAIEKRLVKSYSSACYKECEPQIIELSDWDVNCERDYTVWFATSDPEAFKDFGYEPIYRPYTVRTVYCDNCEDCGDGDCAEFLINLKNAINEDKLGLFEAEVFAAADTARDTPLDDAGIRGLDEGVVCDAVLRVTVDCGKVKDFCNIPEVYTFPRGAKVQVGFDWDNRPLPSVDTVQDLSFEVGSGEVARFSEYNARGYDESPYRITESGVQFDKGLTADVNDSFITINLDYDLEDYTGFQNSERAAVTRIFVRCEEGDAAADLAEILDGILDNFDAQKAIVDDCDCIPND